jgi:hypothetical protein
VDHEAQQTHLCGTALVQLDGPLLELGLLIERVPAEVNESIAEVTNEFVSGSVDRLHEGELQEANEEEDLAKKLQE